MIKGSGSKAAPASGGAEPKVSKAAPASGGAQPESAVLSLGGVSYGPFSQPFAQERKTKEEPTVKEELAKTEKGAASSASGLASSASGSANPLTAGAPAARMWPTDLENENDIPEAEASRAARSANRCDRVAKA